MKRLHPVRKTMPFAAFEDIPHRLGWKHEYWDGMARLVPGHAVVTFDMDLAPRRTVPRRGLRGVTRNDEPALVESFIAAFALAPEYVGYPLAKFRQRAAECVAGFFAPKDGTLSPATVVGEVRGEVAAAAFIKATPKRAVLKCLWVRPDCQRRGWATSLVAHAANALAKSGETTLRSFVQLANPESLAWHHRFGFHEVPDEWVASARWRHYQWEYRRLKRANASNEEIAATEAQMHQWRDEYKRLEALAHENFAAAHPLLDR